MIRFLIFILITISLMYGIYDLLKTMFGDNTVIIDKPKKKKEDVLTSSKSDTAYWWYNAPHYWIMSNGERINIAEYVTWDDWKVMDKQRRCEYLCRLEHRILSTKKDENPDNSEEIGLD